MANHTTRRAQLERRLATLEKRLHGTEDEPESAPSCDWEELASEREIDEFLEGYGINGQEEIRMIKAVIARLDSGESDYCETCGDKFSEDGLDIILFSPFCRKCAP